MGAGLLLFALCVLLVGLICLLVRTAKLKRIIFMVKGKEWFRLDEQLGEENSLAQKMEYELSANPDTADKQQLLPAAVYSNKIPIQNETETTDSLAPQWNTKMDPNSRPDGVGGEELNRNRSVESIASSLFSNAGNDEPTVVLTIQYQKEEQMLQVEVQELYDAPQDASFYLLIYLLPHPKPLWKTKTFSTAANLVFYKQTFRQCIRPKDLNKIALSVQLHISREGATLKGQNRIALRHLDLNAAEPISVTLLKNASQDHTIGELYVSLAYQHGRLSVAVLEVRSLNALCDDVLVRIYLVESNGRIIRKRTSPRKLVSGGAVFNESIFINLSRTQLQQSTLRLSLTQQLGIPSFGRVTIGLKADDKGLVHWHRMMKSCDRPVFMWHPVKAK